MKLKASHQVLKVRLKILRRSSKRWCSKIQAMIQTIHAGADEVKQGIERTFQGAEPYKKF